MPKRVQRRRAKGWKMPPNTVYVGRPTKWGNPFKVGRDGDAAYCLQLYRQLALGNLCLTLGPVSLMAQRRARTHLEQAGVELRGKDLACFCKLHQPCHADVLLEIANREAL
jgi:hypothetical protein